MYDRSRARPYIGSAIHLLLTIGVDFVNKNYFSQLQFTLCTSFTKTSYTHFILTILKGRDSILIQVFYVINKFINKDV